MRLLEVFDDNFAFFSMKSYVVAPQDSSDEGSQHRF